MFAQNIDCGYTSELPRRGGSNEYRQSIFWDKNKKKKVYPCKPQFFYIKWYTFHCLVFLMLLKYEMVTSVIFLLPRNWGFKRLQKDTFSLNFVIVVLNYTTLSNI